MTTTSVAKAARSTRSTSKPSTPRKRHEWRETITEAFYCADHAWWLRREAVALGYATEMREFAEHDPRPQLKWFMVHLSHGWRSADHDTEYQEQLSEHSEQRWAA